MIGRRRLPGGNIVSKGQVDRIYERLSAIRAAMGDGPTECPTLAFNHADFTIFRIIYVRAATRNVYLSPTARRYLRVYY